MFQDLDASLAAMVGAEPVLQNVAISFAGPGEEFPPLDVKLPAISFFLYDIREDSTLRTSGWELEKDAAGYTSRRRSPVRVTCSYLITAWPGVAGRSPAEDEHWMLGELLKVLLRHRTIPAEYLRGDLVGQAPPLPTRILADNQLHSLGEFWQAMGGRPKASLHYAITVSVDVAEAVPVGPEAKMPVIVKLDPILTKNGPQPQP